MNAEQGGDGQCRAAGSNARGGSPTADRAALHRPQRSDGQRASWRVGVGDAAHRRGGAARCGGADEEGDGTLLKIGLAYARGAGVHEQMDL